MQSGPLQIVGPREFGGPPMFGDAGVWSNPFRSVYIMGLSLTYA
jgi:hypothetical protein